MRLKFANKNDGLLSALGFPETIGVYVADFKDVSSSTLERIKLPDALFAARDKRRREFKLGRYCAAHALQTAGHYEHVELARLANGLPEWPAGWLGSISHSSLGAIAAVSRRSSCSVLGIDIEQWIDDENVASVQGQVTCPSEVAVLRDIPLRQAVTIVFSAKEALYKALYPEVGKFFDFTATRLVSASMNRLTFVLCEDWSGKWQKERLLTVGYACGREHVYAALWLPNSG
jgi:enterobactin synthetase component D